MFVFVVTYVKPLAEVDALMAAHRAHLDRFYASGALVASGRREPRTGGIILGRFPDRAAAEAFAEADPFRQAGVATYEILEFHVTKTDPRLTELAGQ